METTIPIPTQTPMLDLISFERRPMRACAYVERSFEEVVAELCRAGAGSVAAALEAALQDRGGLGEVALEVSGVQVVARRTARMRLSWRHGGALGPPGSATLTVIAARTGRRPLTELLVEASIAHSAAAEGLVVVRRFLEELGGRLERAA